jgi:hypothetical protein
VLVACQRLKLGHWREGFILPQGHNPTKVNNLDLELLRKLFWFSKQTLASKIGFSADRQNLQPSP